MSRFHVVVVGGGAGGLSFINRLVRKNPNWRVTLIEPQKVHFYQPAWSLVSMGLYDPEATRKPLHSFIPRSVEWIQARVEGVDPQANKVYLSNSQSLEYDFLVVAPGLELNWSAYENVRENLGQGGVFSVYEYQIASLMPRAVESFEKGVAVFIHPVAPIKCAGAPQKVLYMFEHLMRLKGVRSQVEVIFVTAGAKLFGIPIFNEKLEAIVKERHIKVIFQHVLEGIDPQNKQARFRSLTDNSVLELSYDFLHVVPPQKAPSFVQESGLAWDEGPHRGWLALHKHTLQHVKYPNIFGIGDVTGIPNAKTGAAVRKQYPIVVENLRNVASGQAPGQFYNGYSSCPLITEIGKVMLAEFGYDDRLLPTFPVNPAQPRRAFWFLKKYLLPQLYWQLMLKGLGGWMLWLCYFFF